MAPAGPEPPAAAMRTRLQAGRRAQSIPYITSVTVSRRRHAVSVSDAVRIAPLSTTHCQQLPLSTCRRTQRLALARATSSLTVTRHHSRTQPTMADTSSHLLPSDYPAAATPGSQQLAPLHAHLMSVSGQLRAGRLDDVREHQGMVGTRRRPPAAKTCASWGPSRRAWRQASGSASCARAVRRWHHQAAAQASFAAVWFWMVQSKTWSYW